MTDATDGKTVTKIANSDLWGALGRIGGIVAAFVCVSFLVPLMLHVAGVVEDSAKILVQHSGDIDHLTTQQQEIKQQLDKIDGRTSQDHDHLGTLDGQMLLQGNRLDAILASNAAGKAVRDGQIADIKDSLNRLWQRVGMRP